MPEHLDPLPTPAAGTHLHLVEADALPDSFLRFAQVFHDVLSEQSLEKVLGRVTEVLSDLIPHDSLTIYMADEQERVLVPVLVNDPYAEKILASVTRYGEGITGWAIEHRQPVLANRADLDPRVKVVPGTPADEPESLIAVPLIARGRAKGVLDIYRQGIDSVFTAQEFELAKFFGDAVALALDNAEAKARLEHQAQTDPLTGLYNHRTFHERLRIELTRANRERGSVALVMLDLDDFKRVNDIHGHAVGDEALLKLAELIRSAARSYDVVCRVGGEEFAVIIPGANAQEGEGIARRISQLLAETELGPAGRMTVSVGIAHGPEHAMNPRELIACAEAAMMTAKARGKSRIVLFDESSMERPSLTQPGRDVRSIAHLKMLQSLAARLNRLNDVAAIGEAIAEELRTLVDYHNCRVYLLDGEELRIVAFRGGIGTRGNTEPQLGSVPLGQGVTGTAAATGRSLLIPDGANCEFALQVPDTEKIDESLIATPLLFGSRVIGVILVSKLGLAQFDDDDVRLIEVLSGHASAALENARLYEAQRQEAQRARETAQIANALLDFGRELVGADGLEEVLEQIAVQAAKLLGAPQASVWLQDAPGAPVVPRATYGFDEQGRQHLMRARISHDLGAQMLARGHPFLLDDRLQALVCADTGLNPTMRGAVAPLEVDGRIGGIGVASNDLPEQKLVLLAGMANQAKLAIASASNFASLEATFVSTIEALATALEANDEYTSEHARSITDMSLSVGAALGLDAKALKRLELGALFHDIGKIGVPNHILRKPGRLTDEERRIVEQHPDLGARILAPIERLAEVGEIVRACHERWDGAGYPRGLAGDEIPIEARIIFVCDAFDAMTTDRPYRGALGVEEACRRLREGAGTQFDPRVVEEFLSLQQQGVKTSALSPIHLL